MTNSTIPKTYWITSIAALLWNLMGFSAFIMQVTMSAEAMAALPQNEQDLYTTTPAWMNIIFAIAVTTGVLGSVALLMKKSWAVMLFMICLIVVIIQQCYWLFFTNASEVYGSEVYIMPFLVVLIAIYLYFFSKRAHANGWIG